MGAYVCATFKGRRFHDDPNCTALDDGRRLSGGRYDVHVILPANAARRGCTACRVCVPPHLALPATGATYGHEPVTETGYSGPEQVCARCHMPRLPMLSMPWPCTSAVVLGLVVVDADRWNVRYPVGTSLIAFPGVRPGHPTYDPYADPLITRTRTPAWRLGHGASVVSVDGYAGGIALTHVDPL